LNNFDLSSGRREIKKIEFEEVEKEFGIKTKGMCFGYDGLISGKDRSSSVYAREPTEMFILDGKFFEESFSV
jgi:CRP-like cAMP-binding protein